MRDLLTGTLVGKAGDLWTTVTHLDLGKLLGAAGTAVGLALKDVAAKWNDPDVIKRWNFRGFVVGEALVQVLLTVFSGGAFAALKAVSRAGELADLIARVPVVERLVGAAGDLKGAGAEALRGALTGLKGAQEWAATVLKIPAEVLVDLSADAINRLRTLPPWLQERLSQLNVPGLRRALGCASPCMVDIKAVRQYLIELAATDETGAHELTTMQQVIDALGLPPGADATKLENKLRRLDIMDIIREGHLTDKDFAKIRAFIPDRSKISTKDTYDLFSQYLSAVIPSKFGPDIDKFYTFTSHLTGPSGRSSKGAMFENFARLYLFDDGAERARVIVPDGFINSDLFEAALGAMWDCKNQETLLSNDLVNKYVGIVGKATDKGYVVRSINFLFPTRTIAEVNRSKLKSLGFKVWYVLQNGATPKRVELP